jgi:hypothetical protein
MRREEEEDGNRREQAVAAIEMAEPPKFEVAVAAGAADSSSSATSSISTVVDYNGKDYVDICDKNGDLLAHQTSFAPTAAPPPDVVDGGASSGAGTTTTEENPVDVVEVQCLVGVRGRRDDATVFHGPQGDGGFRVRDRD